MQKVSDFQKSLFQLGKLIRQDLERQLEQVGAGITVLQYTVLRLLHDGGDSLHELADQLSIKPPSLIPSVDALEDMGLVSRSKTERDRRKTSLLLTDKGSRLLKKIPHDTGSSPALQRALNDLSNKDQSELIRLLQLLTGHMHKHL